MLPARYDLTIHQGATLQRWFKLQYPDGSIADLSSEGFADGYLTVRDAYGGDALLVLTTDNGGIDLTYQADADGVYWSGYIYASAVATGALEDWGDGVYDFEITDGFNVHRIMQGYAWLSPESTT
jgi:hypothetical protein